MGVGKVGGFSTGSVMDWAKRDGIVAVSVVSGPRARFDGVVEGGNTRKSLKFGELVLGGCGAA